MQPRRHLDIAVDRWHPPLGIDQVAVRLGPGAVQVDKRRRPTRRVQRPPGRDAIAPLQSASLAPIHIGPNDPVQRPHIEHGVGTLFAKPLIDIAIGQFQFGRQPRPDRVGQFVQRIALRRAAQQKLFRAALAQPQADRLQRADQRFIAQIMRLHHHVRQRLPGQPGLFALVEGAKARRQFGFQREGGQQLLAKAVNGLDAQAAAGGFQHFGEEAPGLLLLLRPMIFAQCDQVTRQRGPVHLNPCRQSVMDAVRHFRGARLGEGQAQDIFRPHALQ